MQSTRKNKLFSAVLISANVLALAAPAAVPVAYAAEANQTPATTQSSSTNGSKASEKSSSEKKDNTSEDNNKDKEQSTVKKNDDKSSIKIVTNTHTNKDDPDNPQNLKEQTMIIRKVVATSEKDLSSDSLQGVNGAKFTVYDVTDLMNTIIKEKLKVDESNPSDKQVDNALAKADDTDTKAQEMDLDTNNNAENSKENSESKKDDSKIPPVYKWSKSSSEKDKSSKTTEESKSSSTTDKKDDSKDKSSSQSSVDSKSKSDKSDDKAEASSKSSSEKEKDDDTDDALIEQVEEMRKDDTIRKEIASRAAKIDPKEMKTFAEVTTGHDSASKKDGVARVKLPIDGKYHAYYVVNTSTPKEAKVKNSDPIVVITPITDDNGKYSPEFTVYPKSEKIPDTPKPATPNTPQSQSQTQSQNQQPGQTQHQNQVQETPGHTVTETKMYQTGRSNNIWNNIVSYLKGLFE
ncbi:pilin N-terminal domain-containing protein [Lactobacillus taiwanensis]|uniref:pilin N-terminal domain-containing protein n=1 Tax=Lactobacillus taiwanensis TaxID=508451 RepID=UPI00241C80CA|nr:pilin N-terminal domain-containing protein [Lactobacillus taiwanensis]